MERIHSLEAVRGLLSLWVVIGHTILHAGYSGSGLGPLKLLAMPGLAVDVFIILSGFVIFFLLDNQRVPYGQFLVKRWFRLVPLLIAVLLVSALTLNAQLEVIKASPFMNDAVRGDLKLHIDSITSLRSHLVAHVTMLHGVIPDSILPSSQFAVVGQAWSISLEWQFYLVAPLAFALVAAQRWTWLGIFLGGLCVLRSLNFENVAFLVYQVHYFIVGILSYYGWKSSRSMTMKPEAVDVLALCAIALVYLMLSRTASLIVWIAVMTVIVAERRNAFSRPQLMASKALNGPVVQWLGKISYSIYLVHMLVFYAFQWVITSAFPDLGIVGYIVVMLPVVVGGTIAVSALSYRFIEQPGIQTGRKVSAYLRGLATPRVA